GLPLLVAAVTVRHWRHARRRGSPVIAVDPGVAVVQWYPGTTDQPRSVDQPRKCDGSGGCAWCGAGSEARGAPAPAREPVTGLPGAWEPGVPVRAAGDCRTEACR